ncbi:hypothetical protein J6590_005448 [Homalodisca vitripennis]|nr:hypothetical protein J6590_005448 [Homalodisca vitripennis]
MEVLIQCYECVRVLDNHPLEVEIPISASYSVSSLHIMFQWTPRRASPSTVHALLPRSCPFAPWTAEESRNTHHKGFANSILAGFKMACHKAVVVTVRVKPADTQEWVTLDASLSTLQSIPSLESGIA